MLVEISLIFLLTGVYKTGFTTVNAAVSLNMYYNIQAPGGSTTIRCSLTGGDTFQYWKYETGNKVLSDGSNEGNKVQVKSNANRDQVDLTLSIDEDVAGNYSCVGSQNIKYFILEVELSFDFATCKEKQHLVYGTNDEIGCLVRGYPTPTMKWTRKNKVNGLFENIADSRFTPLSSGALSVKNVIEDDAGDFQLFIEQQPRSASKQFQIRVYHATKIDREASPRIIYTYLGNEDTIKLSCNASGFPVPKIRLSKSDNYNLDHLFDDVIDTEGFHSVQFKKDYNEKIFGTYMWNASNAVNSDTFGVRIEKAEKPKLVHVDKEIIGLLNGETRVKCKLTGKPYPTVIWSHNEKKLDDSRKYKTLNAEDQEGDLLIYDTTESDVGEYTCFAYNMLGNVTGNPKIVRVEEPSIVVGERTASKGLLVGIILAVILALIICLDLFCCFFNNCGVCFCCYESFCNRKNSASKSSKSENDVISAEEKMLQKNLDQENMNIPIKMI